MRGSGETTGSPFVSVIIPVYNDTERLRLCLEALSRQTYPSKRFEVIVVDNSSDPPVTTSIDAGANVKVIVEPRPGSYAARNTGIACAAGSVLAFTDSDCIPALGWLEAGLRALGDRRAIIGGAIDVFPKRAGAPTVIELYDITWGLPQESAAPKGHVATANLIAPADAFREVGLFSVVAFSGGDYEWSGRAHAAGYEAVYAPDAVVHHPARDSLAATRQKLVRLAGGAYSRSRVPGDRWQGRYEALVESRPPLRRIRWALQTADLDTPWQRARFIGVLLYLRYVYARTWLSLELGARPERR